MTTKIVRNHLAQMNLNPTQMKEINKVGGMDRALCATDGCFKLSMVKGKKADGTPRYAAKCSKCNNEESHLKEMNHRKHLLKVKVVNCDDCDVELNVVDVEVHHKDGNHYNNNRENLANLCANCHLVYTLNERHYDSYEVRFGMTKAEMKAKMKASGHYYGRGK